MMGAASSALPNFASNDKSSLKISTGDDIKAHVQHLRDSEGEQLRHPASLVLAELEEQKTQIQEGDLEHSVLVELEDRKTQIQEGEGIEEEEVQMPYKQIDRNEENATLSSDFVSGAKRFLNGTPLPSEEPETEPEAEPTKPPLAVVDVASSVLPKMPDFATDIGNDKDSLKISTANDMKTHLQHLLDSKEKQLQQVGSLGQRVLAQQMELEERVRQIQEVIEEDRGEGGEEQLDEETRDRYRQLADTLLAWNDENAKLSSAFGSGSKRILNATSHSPNDLEPESTNPTVSTGGGSSSAAAQSRRAKSAAHRADDVEFAFEIGSGLLTEVRRLQSLLGERDKAIQDMKEEKDDLERIVEGLRINIRQNDKMIDGLRSTNWNLEVTLRDLQSTLSDSQSSNQRLESEAKRLIKGLSSARDSADSFKTESEKSLQTIEELKAKHEIEVAQARRHAAGLVRDRSGLQELVDTLKASTRDAADSFKTESEKLQTTIEELKAKHEFEVAQERRHATDLARDKSSLQQIVDTLEAEAFGVAGRRGMLEEPFTPGHGGDHLDSMTPAGDSHSSAMISAQDLQISGGIFTQNNYTQYDPHILKHIAFQSLPRSPDAAFNAATSLNNSRRSCTKGTRVEIIAKIMAWVKDKKAPPVYWLTGLAGLGKTTIAYTICESLDKARLPFASFFCSLQLDSRSSKLLVNTLCRDLAELYNPYAANVLSILETNSKIVDAGLHIQIDELLAKPWQTSIAQRSNLLLPIVVVDALDESDYGAEFLEELLRVIHVGQLAGIKFLVTSRPDPKIVDICKSFPPNAVFKLHEVDTANVQNDVEKYLREALPELKGEPELALLSQRAGGLFIYATTAVRFISPPHSPPSISEMRSHLQAMLNDGPSTTQGDERSLVDELYERILAHAFPDARVRATRLRILHTIVCAESGIDVSVLADLTNTDQDTVRRVAEALHAVLFVSSKDGRIYWYHASFPDFLFTQSRARFYDYRNYSMHEIDVFCDPPSHHAVLAQRCFTVLQESLHFNMCNLPSSYKLDCEVFGLDVSIDRVFSPTVRYVSRQWARHLVQAVPAENEADILFRDLKDFLHDKLVFWIEAMNLIDAKTECSRLLRDSESWLKKGKELPDLLGDLADAINFTNFFAGSPASKSTPHLYISALSMWNQDSPIWTTWRHWFTFGKTGEQPWELQGHIPSVYGNRIDTGSEGNSVRVWNAKTDKEPREPGGHTSRVTSVTLSLDGTRIVSGSWDKSMRVWDVKTGQQVMVLHGHTDHVNSVAFSPDGNRIVSGSRDKSVRVWDAETGGQLRKLQGHTDWVNSVGFSPDGNQVVSGSWDKSVRVWDSNSGKQLRELQGHTHIVTSFAFSPDGNEIVSGSWDDSLQVWDAKTGELLRELRGHTNWVASVAFSPTGDQIVSGSDDDSLRVWDTKTGELLRILQGHIHDVTSVAFSPDGDQIVSGSWDCSVRMWDVKTGKQLRELQGHTGHVTSVTFSPNGEQIISGSNDHSVRVWANLNLDAPWVVKEDGWIVSGAGRLVWMPSTICTILLCPHNIQTISRNGSVTISFKQSKLGTSWHECYIP